MSVLNPKPAGIPICTVVDTVYNLVLSTKYELSTVKSYSSDLKSYYLTKMSCSTANPACTTSSLCTDNIIYFDVSCSLCIFELDNPRTPCAYNLNAGTSYSNEIF